MLSVKNIQYSIGSKQILQDVSIDFLPGRFNMILGPNGSGKSTLLKIFSGELRGYKGNVLYDERKISDIKTQQLARMRSVLSQQPDLDFPLLVREVVMMGRYPHFDFDPTKKDENICSEAMEQLNILHLGNRNYLTLSGGEKQRVQFARVLAQVWEKPAEGLRYLFLDEPLASLDINYQLEFLQITKAFADQHTVVVAVMHDINQALQFGDVLFFLKEGKVVSQGAASAIFSAELIKNVFDVDCRILKNDIDDRLVVYFISR